MATKKKTAKKKITKRTTATKAEKVSSPKPVVANKKIKDAPVVFKLEKNLTVSNAKDLKQKLLSFVKNTDTVEIDGNDVEIIDTAGLQILTSFIIYSKNNSIEVKWTGISEVLKSTADIIGISNYLEI